jgi:ribosomal protein L16 Arg81 hydroxylase
MVHVTAPDLDQYPRYAAALEVAQEAELEPGDAIFIPRDWYHHVEALDRFNVLVNYWWDAAKDGSVHE